ncbi:hypothetical protein JOF46_003901 [Paeniglutamicibacter psychrophenolicus]|uniref:Uncharacterized protein n=1 Tax=Paeniglutamicibacter psychrophenolicus TaxID=257454 RepID=A0ABS4WIF0_9MICC|nr:hypothetical protein [Paeniglutamicibacter psychrophenolicus]
MQLGRHKSSAGLGMGEMDFSERRLQRSRFYARARERAAEAKSSVLGTAMTAGH